MAIKTEPTDSAAQERAARLYEKATASPITQISGDIAHRAVGAAAMETVNDSLSKIQKDMKDLNEIYKNGGGASKEAKDLEESINAEARHAGSIMEIFKKDLPAGMSVDAMNNMIIAGAKEIYGSTEGHIHYHDISAVHDVKSHLRQEVHKTHDGISTSEMNPGDVGSILQNVEARVGELLATSLAAMNVDPQKLDYMLKQIALSAVERDYKGASGAETTGPVNIVELGGEDAQTAKLSQADINKINDNLRNFSIPKVVVDESKTKSEHLKDAKNAIEWMAGSGILGASSAEKVSHLLIAASSFEAAGEHKKAGKYYSNAAEEQGASNAIAAGMLHEKAGDAFREGGSTRKAVKAYEKAAAIAQKLSDSARHADMSVKSAAAIEGNGGLRRAAHTLEKAAQLVDGAKKSEIQERLGDVYSKMTSSSSDKTAIHYYTEAVGNAEDGASKARIREKIKKVEVES